MKKNSQTNGVILIETKKGERDRISLSDNGYVGLQMLGSSPEVISTSADYMELWNEAITNAGGSPRFPNDVHFIGKSFFREFPHQIYPI